MTAVAPEGLTPLKRAIVEIRDLKARVAAAERREHEPIAVIGIGLRFPGGANDPDSYWRLLWDGVDAVTEVPADRWDVDRLFDPDPEAPGRTASRYGGFLDHVDQFDAPFFGISPREAESLDPQQRLLLEVTWEALEHAGVAPDRLFGTDAGVFLGIANSDHLRLLLAEPDQVDLYATTGNIPSVAAGRLSYVLGTYGPAVALDTACSSSLVAVHLAMQSLRAGECDLALAGGVSLVLTPELTISFSQLMTADGRAKAFDARADGYVRSEGCGQVVLKRLSDAQADGDRVLAVLRGSAMNHDGRSGGLTAPNGPSQERVITAALARAGLPAGAVDYVEAHGTGTALGDPIEAHALGAVLCQGRTADDPLLVGSVKTNLGHLESAAGIAGLIKVVLMLQHGAIPPHLHLQELNPLIAAEGLPLAVPTERTDWPARPGGRVAGVSSFGLSGTNAHVVLAEAPPPPASAAAPADDLAAERPVHVLPLSAKDPAALADLAVRYADHLRGHPETALSDVAFTAGRGRSHHPHRLAIVARDGAEAIERLDAFTTGADGAPRAGRAAAAPELAFLFTGHGSHHPGMGRRLYAEQPDFRRALDACDERLRGQVDRSLPEILFGDGDLLARIDYVQPALFSLQYALAELWRSWGVVPSVVAGHSAGEYAAAVVAGALSLDDGLRLVTARGRLLATLPPGGEMVALFADEERVAAAVAAHAASVGIAAVNGPTATVISGRHDAVRAVIEELELDDDDVRRLDVPVAGHSPLVDPILDALERCVATARLQQPEVRLVSCMTGSPVSRELTDPTYWRRHLREPVRFAAVFDTLREAGVRTFLEIGPHPTLLGLGQRSWPDATGTWVPSLRRDGDDWVDLATSLATLYTAGIDVDWEGFDRPYPRRRVALPTYPFQRRRYWSPAARLGGAATTGSGWDEAVAAAARQAEQGPFDLEPNRYAERWERLDELATAFTIGALRRLDLFTRSGEEHRVRDLVTEGRLAADHALIVERWLQHLTDDGLLQVGPDGTFRGERPLPEPSTQALVAATARDFDGLVPLLDYVCRCGAKLASVLAGDERALGTMFPDGSLSTVEFLYGDWAVARYVNAIARAALAAVAAARPRHALRVIEVGAGTGGTAAVLLPALGANGGGYAFTDVSELFLVRAAERFAEAPGVRFARLDIEQPPVDQGLEPEGYDVVVATNVLDGTADLARCLAHARSLVGPGGVLIASVTTRHPRWLDLTTGLVAGWRRMTEEERRREPVIAPERWPDLLHHAGFTDVEAWPRADQPTAVLGQQLLLARVAGEPSARPAAAEVEAIEPSPDADQGATVGAVESFDALTAALSSALPSERIDVLVDIVRGAISRVLRITDPGELDRDQPLLDLGLDSLMAVELRNVLRDTLRLPKKLPATLLFDHPNIAAIAGYLEHLVFGAPAADEPVVPEPAGPTTTPQLGVDAIAALSDAEVEALLLQKLSEI